MLSNRPNSKTPRQKVGPMTTVGLPAVLVLTVGCGTTPRQSYPTFVDHRVLATFEVPANGLLRVPATTRDLVVHELALQPTPRAERYDAEGRRFLVYDRGTTVTLEGRFRVYATATGVPTPAEILPGAATIAALPIVAPRKQDGP